MKPHEIILPILAALSAASHAADILSVFPHVGKSHFFMFEPYLRALSDRGHKITLISHYRPSKPIRNLNFISLEGTGNVLMFNSLNLEENENLLVTAKLSAIRMLNEWGERACETGLGHPPVRKLIDSKPHFDLVIVEYFNTDCFAVFSHIFKAPLMAIFSSVLMPWHYDRFGNPDNPSYIVNHFNSFPSEMTLFERTYNTLATFGLKLYYRVFFNWRIDDIIKKHLGPEIPPVGEIVKNTSAFLVNSHFSIFQARPFVPGIIEVGGIHVKKGEPLPKDLQEYMDNSKNGVIIFTMGSTLLGHTISEEKRRAIAESFRKVPLNVIWKWENETMRDKPKNVLLQKWIPQNDLLAHPNTKLFVTHSGLMGTEEAVYHGVPMLMMPLFGDQPINAASCQEKGLGIVVDFATLTEESFSKALRTILEDKRYAERAVYVSQIFKDRPLPIVETAVYWTEYIIRHKGAPHLRSAAVHLPWYSEYLLDVLLVVCSIAFAAFYTIAFAMKKCLGRRKQSDRKLKKR